MNSHQAVLELIESYFESIYKGDAVGLANVFHPSAQVTDCSLGYFRARSAAEYVNAVASRESPHSQGEARSMKVLNIEVLGNVASVTTQLEMLGQHYYNVLSLLPDHAGWRVVHKVFGNVE